jgi:predicted TIM-barrel fold metal-dependent hydrolase
MIVDVHTHCENGEHFGEEWTNHWQPVYGKPHFDVTPEQYDAAMTEAGVDVAIVFGMAASKPGVHTPSTFVADFAAQLKTPVITFAAMDPSDVDWRDQLEEAISLGFKGVKLYPVLALFDPFAPEFDDFYSILEKNGMVAMWHMGATPSPVGSLRVSQPLVIEEVARRHPDLTQVMAHMGHPWTTDTSIVLRKHRRVFADVSGVPSRPFGAFQALVNAQEWGTVPKLFFGSDYALWTPAEAMALLRGIAQLRAGNLPYVTEETVESIIHRDTLTLLGLDDPRN